MERKIRWTSKMSVQKAFIQDTQGRKWETISMVMGWHRDETEELGLGKNTAGAIAEQDSQSLTETQTWVAEPSSPCQLCSCECSCHCKNK